MMKKVIKRILFRPRRVRLGEGSFIRLPRKISGPQSLIVGERTLVKGSLTVSCIKEYAGWKYDGAVTIGSDVYIGAFCQLHAIHHISIGDGSVLSDFVYIVDSAHGDFKPSEINIMQRELSSKGPISIGKNVFIGMGAIIMSGVSLGDNCVVGAGSVVTKSFPAFSMIGGSPAKLMKFYDSKTAKWIVDK
ncbi:acyltransferase [Robbsia andropogonis]|uniref:acyltransferase n=1 Tax=Robbsia andropogonis TaxID=28092 RepID=UPI00209F1246|nr:acyltransferase [Robbsia andropogonis]MCP1121500.1 acyltransferase [Robbsia andropogonis]MCP1131310.1 acyltransferase [Robbsia andropogonis]